MLGKSPMRFIRLLSILLPFGLMAANSYHTTFPTTENPISEGSVWINGAVTGGANFHNVRVTGGTRAYGTQPGGQGNCSGAGQAACGDSTAVLTGSWGSTQTAQATVSVTGSPADFSEIELRLRTTITAGSITGYEINCSTVAADPYVQIVRWNGGLGDFTVLDARTATVCANGDTLKVTASGSTITVFKNGASLFSVTDSTYTGGSPGIGMYATNTTGQANYGWSDFWACDSVPVLDTTTASSVTSSGASSGGTVVNNCGASVSSEGTCYATSANPTTPCTADGTSTPFTSTITGLSASTLYHYRSFATNSNGTGYGPDLTFTTSAAANAAVYAGGIIE